MGARQKWTAECEAIVAPAPRIEKIERGLDPLRDGYRANVAAERSETQF
jgi:hypothetical protein